MQAFVRQRPYLVFLIAVVIFISTAAWRTLQSTDATSVTVVDSVPAPVAPGNLTTIGQLQAYLRTHPDDTDAHATLGLSLLYRVRETADPQLYVQAEAAFDTALEHEPHHFNALVGKGMLALSRHQFTEALEWGNRALEVNPHNAQPYGIIGDALTEFGQYDAAVAAIQKMVDLRPDVRSYSRVSYQRELHGNTEGAIESMEKATNAGNRLSEETLWARVELGHLYFNQGDLANAEKHYLEALELRPDYVYAFAGMARVRAAQGQIEEAIQFYDMIVEQLPLPEFAIALGDLHTVAGNEKAAQQQYELVHTIQKLNNDAGMDTELEMVRFLVDQEIDPTQAVVQARATYAQRPSIYAADTLAWALYQQGVYEEARQYSEEALRLGTRDATLHFHAGMIAMALDDTDAAHEHLQLALSINPHFSLRYAPQAQEHIATLAIQKEVTR
ncbi:MAG: Tetratricopeptide (TPR) repeat [Chloroflexi bacterium AL-W]|nr:Tetratricopeptide (TPR) repeat [Chloroflexi bacterium AL-N1]NOK65620.1 Tetratricopeptide (TPR) repeat [Chloroflexi bacterium AL-N10]NOK74439.1 Tetratricopeptide (TPR) repeat [Chloroflexi bacterium AL-N5]NOK80653.1 Tetratricopeptide (TPR) repeat [Chloroflexi bacterium AL-W]NOK88697.1 Tetratricopeptide (TPR) repeat [Chloroflexi bacterium AL-N15]